MALTAKLLSRLEAFGKERRSDLAARHPRASTSWIVAGGGNGRLDQRRCVLFASSTLPLCVRWVFCSHPVRSSHAAVRTAQPARPLAERQEWPRVEEWAAAAPSSASGGP